MERVTRKILDYIYEIKRTMINKRLQKDLKQEVDINGTGTHKYRIKEGPNKGKVL
jgi:hypothetical protein